MVAELAGVGRCRLKPGANRQLPSAVTGMHVATARAMSYRPRVAVLCGSTVESRTLAAWLTEEGSSQSASRPTQADPTNYSVRARPPRRRCGVCRRRRQRRAARRPLLPIVVLGAPDAAAESHAKTRGAIYLTRPVDRALFGCTIAMAIADTVSVRRSVRTAIRLSVVVQGVASQIIDVSKEGMRVEIPRRLTVPPPLFDVVVPMLGVKVNVRRLWTASAQQSEKGPVWYGGELSGNSRRAEMAWLTLIDALSGPRASLKLQ